MTEAGVLERALPAFALSGAEANARLVSLATIENASAIAPRWTRRMAALLGEGSGGDAAAPGLTDALRLSRSESAAMVALKKSSSAPPSEAAYRWGADAAIDAAALRAAKNGGDALDADMLAAIETGAEAVFPIAAQDLIDAGFQPGPKLGAALRAAERDWIAHGFNPDPAPLLERSRAAIGLGDVEG